MQGFRAGRLPPRLTDKTICLFLPGLFDLYWLSRVLRQADRDVLENLGLKRPPGAFTCAFILFRSFNWVYLIKRRDRKVGLLGSYDWEPGRHAFLSLVIWSKTERGRGTGSLAIRLALRELAEKGLCREFFVEVKKCNHGGIRFWKRNGFSQIDARDETVLMHLACT